MQILKLYSMENSVAFIELDGAHTQTQANASNHVTCIGLANGCLRVQVKESGRVKVASEGVHDV